MKYGKDQKKVNIEPEGHQISLRFDGSPWDYGDEEEPGELLSKPPEPVSDVDKKLKNRYLSEIVWDIDRVSASSKKSASEIAGVLDYASKLKISEAQKEPVPEPEEEKGVSRPPPVIHLREPEPVEEAVTEDDTVSRPPPVIRLRDRTTEPASEDLPEAESPLYTLWGEEVIRGVYVRRGFGRKFNSKIFKTPIRIPTDGEYTIQTAVDQMRGEGLLDYIRGLEYEGRDVGKTIIDFRLNPLVSKAQMAFPGETIESLLGIENPFSKNTTAYKAIERFKDYLRPLALLD